MRKLSIPLFVGAALLVPALLQAQEFTWTVSALGGLGTSIDNSGSADLGLQVGGALVVDRQTNIWLRVGTLGFDTGNDQGSLRDADLTYVNIGGEYQFFEGYYDSGVFLGLGAYNLDATRLGASGSTAVDDTVLGLVLGVSGEFKVTPKFAFLVEAAGHIIDNDDAQVIGTIHAGVAWHF
ncbi:MAG: hypothetical protein R2991_14595 [Thermoanaerobaculia bacterium]